MKRLLLLTIMLVMTFNVSAQDSNYILLECSSSNNVNVLMISIDKVNRYANYEYLTKGSATNTAELLPVEFTENEIKITQELSTEELTEKGFPEGMVLATQMRISRKSLALKMYGSINGGEFQPTQSGVSACALIKSNESGNQI
jgi:hypothetical protein